MMNNQYRRRFTVNGKTYRYASLQLLEKDYPNVRHLPKTIRLLLESALRQYDGKYITQTHIEALANWGKETYEGEVPFQPARIIFQDFTGVPAVVDLAAMRDAVAEKGSDPKQVNPKIPVDLVIDHSVIIESSGTDEAFEENVAREFERNEERYRFIKWAQQSFDNFRVVPPSNGIVHQVNLEYLATGVQTKPLNGETYIYADTLVGTDSHTPMINGIGTLGWGVGGIEAEASMLGEPMYFVMPEVIGVRLTGRLREGVTATDLALTMTERLRAYGVVGKYVEFFGPGVATLPVTDRATISNMAPEYGATMSFFPTDEQTFDYFRETGREALVPLWKTYAKVQKLLPEETDDIHYTDVIEVALDEIEPSLAGPKRPQDRVSLSEMASEFEYLVGASVDEGGFGKERPRYAYDREQLADGSVVLAAITSCTNTSNPHVMVAAGLLAKKAAARGLTPPSYVKTSLAPGSRVVTRYLESGGLREALERVGFYVDGYGCAMCCGNTGDLKEGVSEEIQQNEWVASSVISGNRNFEGRIHPDIPANYLASPPLVVAYALAGRVTIDFATEPIAIVDGQPIYLKELWPSSEEIEAYLQQFIETEMYTKEYETVDRNEAWDTIEATSGVLYDWDEASTYIQRSPYFDAHYAKRPASEDLQQLVPLLVLGDSITTDHISPVSYIPTKSEAGRYLSERGLSPEAFNNYGSRRGNHHVMVRGTFANVRLRNELASGRVGGWTKDQSTGEIATVYEVAQRYMSRGVGSIVLAGKEYGTGSSRDWAAKGTKLLGVRIVLAESFERIHRSNLVGMGVLPLQFLEGESKETYALTGEETYSVKEPIDTWQPGEQLTVNVVRSDQTTVEIPVVLRLDNDVELEHYRNGGILLSVYEDLLHES